MSTTAVAGPEISSSAEKQPAQARPHLLFLDGLRGIAALYVALFHASSFVESTAFSPPLRVVADCLRYGHLAVGVFIVLSGFCLMLPVVTSGSGKLPRGVLDYLRRRAWRILPPYYAAFLLSAALLAIGFFLRGTGAVQGDDLRSGFTAGSLLSHLFLVHNLNFEWAYSINAPLWTVATEWQIYFLFPLFLLPVWRLLGRTGVIAFGLALGLAPVLLLPVKQNLWWAGPWYLGLFAMGMSAADYALGGTRQNSRPWALAVCLAGLGMVVFLCSLPLDAVPLWLIDVFVGFAAAGLIAHLAESARHRPEDKPPVLLRALQSPLAARLGAFSYSLYLSHQPIQKGMLRVLQTLHLSVDQTLYLQFCVGMPLILALSYLFHRVFEVPFLSRNRKSAAREPKPDASLPSRGACVSPLPDSSAG